MSSRAADPATGAAPARLLPTRSSRRIQARRCQTDRERVLDELAWIALSDISNVFDPAGRLIPLADLPPNVRAAVKRYEVRSGTDRGQGFVVEMWPKIYALAALARHLGRRDRPSPRPSRALLVRLMGAVPEYSGGAGMPNEAGHPGSV